MPKIQRFPPVLGVGLALFSALTLFAQTAPRQYLRGHVPEAVSRLQPLGRFPGTNRLSLAIGLPLRNEAALDDLLRQIYDPASPNFRHYLTPEQFTEQFGSTEQDYQAVIDFAKANGLQVTATYPNRTLLDVSGSVAMIEKVFHVTLHRYQHPTENRTFFAPDKEPSVDLNVPLSHISGLDDFTIPRPMSLRRHLLNSDATSTPPASGSGPTNSYMGNDFRAAYAPGVTLNGAGQSVGLLELDGYYTNDITAYEKSNGLPNVTLTNILIDSFSGSPGGNNSEVALDIEVALAMAPGLSKIIVYEGTDSGSSQPVVDILNRMASDNLAKQISSSWTIGDNSSYVAAYKQFATQGQSFFQASGDDGAFYSGIQESADDTNVTLVGGTTLYTTGPGGTYVSETVWNWDSIGEGPGGSGGGISLNNLPIPSWQQGINMTTNQGSTAYRNVPDVAMTADNIFIVADNGRLEILGGTSAAAPLWAGFTALINQQVAALGKTNTVGFLNPAIYTIGNGPNYTADFHDIIAGNNTNTVVGKKYFAVPGYDLCTGWGTPNGINLINDLASPDFFGVYPAGLTALGPVGGPFNASSQTFSLTNAGGTALNWSLIGLPSWATASSSGSLLAAQAYTNVTISLNSAGINLPAGLYVANLVFTNLTSGVPRSRPIAFQSGLSFIQNGGFENGDFGGWTFAGTGPYDNFVDNGSTTTIQPHSGTYVAILGQQYGFAYLSQTLSTVPGQTYLLSLWLDAPSTGSIQQFMVSWNTNATSSNTIFNQTFPKGTVAWTNLQFIVNATGPSTVLQIAARNDPYYFGLDDVNCWPIPTPSFRNISKVTANAVALTWNSLTNIAYRVEYSTNLINTNWTPLVTNTAAGFTLTITNSIGTNSSRFYRIRQLP
ncbi:MAG: protease pro-enzyme activation domain-containing protein [Verrucomicrobiota bacterium]